VDRVTALDFNNPELAELIENQPPAARPSTGRWFTPGFFLVTTLLLLSPANKLLLYLYPAAAVLGAVHLYRRHLPNYVTLVCWLWFLTPLVRRLLDYRAGWNQPTAILLAPMLASCVPVIWLIAGWRKVLQRQSAPLLCVVATCLYSTLLGMMNFPPRFVFQDLLTWMAPLIFGFMLCQHSDQASELFEAFEKAFLYGIIVVSLYGLYQFYVMPKWDAFWMSWVDMDSIGKPEPTEVRVFSTMNAPQILASFLASGLVIAFTSRRAIRFVTIPLGLICLALSLARSGWVAMFAAIIYLLFTLPQRQRVKLVLVGIIAFVAMLAALQNPDIQEVMSQRFNTFSDVRNDDSFGARIDAYRLLLDGFTANPFGLGMGATPAIAAAAIVVHSGWNQDLGDSTIAMVMTTMGLAGGLVLFFALFLLVRGLFGQGGGNVAYRHTMLAVLIGLIGEAALDGVISGPTAFLTWASVGFCIALGAPAEKPQPATEA
jgi:hypothetical protein